jgi:hypothetical protein
MTTIDNDELVALHRLDVEDLAHLLDRVEDWLRHAGDDTVDDLVEFFHAPGNGRLAAAGMVDLLGRHAATLHRRLEEPTP